MAADSTAYDAVLKEVWTAEKLEEQLYQGNPLLDAIDKVKPIQVGDTAITPVHTGRSGGYSAVPRSGSSALNAATNQHQTQAKWNWTHHWFTVAIETATVDETDNKAKAVASVVDSEVSGAVNDMRKQLTRQAFSNGDALIAKCTTTTTANEIELDPADYGYDAIVRGWLYPDLTVDIGTTGSEATIADAVTITAVEEVAATPSITVSGSTVSTTSSHFVSIANARSGTTSYESNGLRNLFGSASTVIGTLDPATTPVWKPASVDSTTTTLSLPALYNIQKAIFQKTGDEPDWALTGADQYQNLYVLLQAAVRFNGDGNLGAGDMTGLKIGKTVVERQPDCTKRHFFFLTKGDLFTVRTDAPDWAPKKYGNRGGILEWKQNTTQLVSALVHRYQIGCRRRNSAGSLTALT